MKKIKKVNSFSIKHDTRYQWKLITYVKNEKYDDFNEQRFIMRKNKLEFLEISNYKNKKIYVFLWHQSIYSSTIGAINILILIIQDK